MKFIAVRACASIMAFGVLGSPTAQVVGDDACPVYAADIAAFATCDAAGIARQAGVSPTAAASKASHSARHLTAMEAFALLRQAGGQAALVDVRSSIERALVGAPDADHLHVPYREAIVRDATWVMHPNHRFGEQLMTQLAARGIGPEQWVILICRSGELSAQAADELSDFGYARIVTVIDGFEGDLGSSGRRDLNGWKNAGLPWRADVPVATVAIRR